MGVTCLDQNIIPWDIPCIAHSAHAVGCLALAGMYGKEYIEQANTDMVVGCSADVLHKFFDIADAHAAERVLTAVQRSICMTTSL